MKLTPQELKIYKMYGKLPTRSDILQSKLKDRKYFDSGDYAMSKAGVIDSPSSMPVEKLEHPDLEKIQRISRNSISGGTSGQVFSPQVAASVRLNSVSSPGVIGAQNGGNFMFSGKSNLENEFKNEDE